MHLRVCDIIYLIVFKFATNSTKYKYVVVLHLFSLIFIFTCGHK